MHFVDSSDFEKTNDNRGGERSPIERTHFTHAFFISNLEQYVFLLHECSVLGAETTR